MFAGPDADPGQCDLVGVASHDFGDLGHELGVGERDRDVVALSGGYV